MVCRVGTKMTEIPMKKSLTRGLAYFYASLFAAPAFAGVHYFLFRLALRGLGIMNYYDHRVSGEQFFVSNLLPRFVRSNPPTFFDIGANQGEYSRLLAKRFPNAKIFAFEPHPRSYEILSQAKINGLVPVELALSDVHGSVNLYDFAENEGSANATLYGSVLKDIHHQSGVAFAVKTDTLSSFVLSESVEYIDFLKIDTEGSEFAILRGGMSLLEQQRIGVIQFEFNEMNVLSRAFFHDFKSLLGDFSLYRMLPRGLLPLPESPLLTELFGFQNILAIHKEKTHLL
jgi:FkbM family methyltransferase